VSIDRYTPKCWQFSSSLSKNKQIHLHVKLQIRRKIGNSATYQFSADFFWRKIREIVAEEEGRKKK
jgi:hypothetical protein